MIDGRTLFATADTVVRLVAADRVHAIGLIPMPVRVADAVRAAPPNG